MLKTFFVTLASTASVLGIVFIALGLVQGSEWISHNASLILTNGFYLLVVPPIISLALTFQPTIEFTSPKIKKVIDKKVLLVEGQNWLSQQTVVAVFNINEDVERLVAVGVVINIQSNGLVQIECEIPDGRNIELPNLSDMKSSLMIKPGISQ